MFDSNKNLDGRLISDRTEEDEGNTMSSSDQINSYFQSINNPQAQSDIAKSLTDLKDQLIPMMLHDGKVNSDREKLFVRNTKTNHLLINKEKLSAPNNQFALNRIIQEENFRGPTLEQWTDKWDTTFDGHSTTSDLDRNLFTNKVNETKAIVTYISVTPISQTCNSCDESRGKFKKPEEDTDDYSDELNDDHAIRIVLSRHSSLKKPSLMHKIEDKFANSLQNANVVRSELNYSGSNHRMNFSSAIENQKAQQNSKKEQFHRNSRIVDSFKEFIFPLPNYNFSQQNSVTEEPTNTGQPNVSQFSSLKFRNEFSNEAKNFPIKPIKLLRAQVSQNNFMDKQMNTLVPMKKSLKDNSIRRKNFILESNDKQRNMLAQIVHRSSKSPKGKMLEDIVKKTTVTLQFSNAHRKPKRMILVNHSQHYMQKLEIKNIL